MRKGENPSDVLKALKARIELLNSSILPKGVKVVPYYDRTWLIDTTLHTVFKNLAEGAMLVTFVLLLFLGNFRAAAIVAVMIPLSLLATFIGLTWRGIPANLLSLGAMDFGIIVDGAVIVVENVFRRLGELRKAATGISESRTHDRTRDGGSGPARPSSRCSSSSPRTSPSSRCNATKAASSRRWPGRSPARWSGRCSFR